jgi:hypothetical protein
MFCELKTFQLQYALKILVQSPYLKKDHRITNAFRWSKVFPDHISFFILIPFSEYTFYWKNKKSKVFPDHISFVISIPFSE